MNAKVLLRGSVMLASLIGVVLLVRLLDLTHVLDEGWVDSHVRGQGLNGYLIFIAAGALFTGVGLPRQVIAFLGGYAFGVLDGLLLALFATIVGCIASFYYARWLGRDFVAQRFPRRVKRIDNFLSNNPFSMTLLIRFLPVGSNLVTNLAAGVSRVGAPAYFLGSAVGYIPQTLIFALVGSGIKVDPVTNIMVAIGLFAVSGSLGIYLYRKYRNSRLLDEETEAQLDGVEHPAE